MQSTVNTLKPRACLSIIVNLDTMIFSLRHFTAEKSFNRFRLNLYLVLTLEQSILTNLIIMVGSLCITFIHKSFCIPTRYYPRKPLRVPLHLLIECELHHDSQLASPWCIIKVSWQKPARWNVHFRNGLSKSEKWVWDDWQQCLLFKLLTLAF